MRGLSSLPLDDDIIDRILIFLPDYSTLRATLLSSKPFYSVFQVHPNSIIRAISYNVTGPALPQAVRLLRYTIPQANSQIDSSTTLQHNWSEDDPVSPITHEECRQLAQNAKVVKTLEDLFSARHKDRSSPLSGLNSMESWRFRRAMFRLMLLSRISPIDEDEFDDDDDDDDEETNDRRLNEITKARRKREMFLAEFSNDDLHQLKSGASFLLEIAKWAAIAENSTHVDALELSDIIFAYGPTPILEAYRERSLVSVVGVPSDRSLSIYEGYLTRPLNKIWEERKAKPPPEDDTHWNSLIDDINGDKDTCFKCNNMHGLDLWNDTSKPAFYIKGQNFELVIDWEYLRGFSASLSPYALPALAKGNLNLNIVDATGLRAEFHSAAFTYTKLFNDIHHIRTNVYDSWNTQDWLCETCIVELLRPHLHLWFLERKKERGYQTQEDCWYGYNCRTQTHNVHHATRLNHLCEPTR